MGQSLLERFSSRVADLLHLGRFNRESVGQAGIDATRRASASGKRGVTSAGIRLDVQSPVAVKTGPLQVIREGCLFKQGGSSPWARRNYLSNTMAASACGPTSLAMILYSFGIDVNPMDVANYSVRHGHRIPGQGTAWSLFSNRTMRDLAKDAGVKVSDLGGSVRKIRESLQQGHPVIAVVGPSIFTSGGHYIAISGIDEKGNFIIGDPGGRNVMRASAAVLGDALKNAWSFRSDTRISAFAVDPKLIWRTPQGALRGLGIEAVGGEYAVGSVGADGSFGVMQKFSDFMSAFIYYQEAMLIEFKQKEEKDRRARQMVKDLLIEEEGPGVNMQPGTPAAKK